MAGGRVDIYRVDLDAERANAAWFHGLLDAAERARAQRLRQESDRARYIVRHGILRALLGAHLDCAPADVRFVCNRFGKPSLAAGAPRFNLSYSHGLALYAIAEDREVGCDIERRDPGFAADHIAERFFAPREVRALRSLAPARQTAAFFNCWTRKEAFVKARGCGLSLALDSFEVSLTPGEPARLLRGCEGWSVVSFEPAPGYQAAVVAQGTGWRLDVRSLERALSAPAPRSAHRRSPASPDRSARRL